jgi:hypothetical protein
MGRVSESRRNRLVDKLCQGWVLLGVTTIALTWVSLLLPYGGTYAIEWHVFTESVIRSGGKVSLVLAVVGIFVALALRSLVRVIIHFMLVALLLATWWSTR